MDFILFLFKNEVPEPVTSKNVICSHWADAFDYQQFCLAAAKVDHFRLISQVLLIAKASNLPGEW
jgi:hypothetical protein